MAKGNELATVDAIKISQPRIVVKELNNFIVLEYADYASALLGYTIWKKLATIRGKINCVSISSVRVTLCGGNWWTEISGLPMEGDY